jgi:hypothetical protein
MKKNIIKRHGKNPFNNLLFIHKQKRFHLKLKDIEKKININGTIRFLKYDFKFLKKNFYHFNFQQCGHKKNDNYLIVRIKNPGFFNSYKEITPIYDTKNIYIYKCTYIKQYVPYNNINKSVIKKSLKTTNTIEKLFNTIKRRYKFSLNHIKQSEMKDFGVSITGLKYLQKINFSELIK